MRFAALLFLLCIASCVNADLHWGRDGGDDTFTKQLTSISPTSGARRGGVLLTITGTGFTSQSTVTVGGKACPVQTLVSSSELTCRTTTLDPGFSPVTVVVKTPGAENQGLADAFTPKTFVYALSSTPGQLAGFNLASDGSLSPVPGSPVSVTSAVEVAGHPTRNLLFVSSASPTSTLTSYAIDPETGQTTSAGASTVGPGAKEIAVHPTLDFAYVGDNRITGAVFGVPIQADGSLGTGQFFASGDFVKGLAIHPNGNFLFAVNSGDNDVRTFSIGSNGGLTQVGSDVALPPSLSSPDECVLNPEGTFLFVTGGNVNFAAVQSVNAGTGALANITGSPFATAGQNQTLSFEANRGLIYFAHTVDAALAWQTVGPDGALSLAGQIAANAPADVAVEGSGRFLVAVLSGTNLLRSYVLDAGGTPTLADSKSVATGPTGLHIH